MKQFKLFFMIIRKFVGFFLNYPVFVFSFVNKLFNKTKNEKIERRGERTNRLIQKVDKSYAFFVYLLFTPIFALVLLPFYLLEYMSGLHAYYHTEYLTEEEFDEKMRKLNEPPKK